MHPLAIVSVYWSVLAVFAAIVNYGACLSFCEHLHSEAAHISWPDSPNPVLKGALRSDGFERAIPFESLSPHIRFSTFGFLYIWSSLYDEMTIA